MDRTFATECLPSAGFTLIELLIALAVAAVLIGIGAPAFGSIVADRRLDSALSAVESAIRLARVESLKRGGTVSLCAAGAGESCASSWGAGHYLVAEDASGAEGTIDPADTVLASNLLKSGWALDVRALGAVPPSSTASAKSVLSIDFRGRPRWTSGTFVFCDDRGASSARALVIGGSGITRRALPSSTSSGVVVDAFGVAVTCPSS